MIRQLFINYGSFIMTFTLGFHISQQTHFETCKLTFPSFIVFKSAALVFLEERKICTILKLIIKILIKYYQQKVIKNQLIRPEIEKLVGHYLEI